MTSGEYNRELNVEGAGGGDFFGVGARDIFFHAAAASGINVNELDSHAVAGLDATNHAADHDRVAQIEGETQFDGLSKLERMRIEKIEAAGGKIADARNGREELDGNGLAESAWFEPAVSFHFRHARKV